MTTDLATLQPAELSHPLTAVQLRARLAVIQDVMKGVMQRDVDYGVIAGTGEKPTLFKPGAEKICVTFRLSVDTPVIEAVPEYSGDIRYRVQVPIRSSDGTVLAVGIGECSTGEEKYRWRRPVHPKEFETAPEDQRRQKYTRKGEIWDQVRVHPADVANTVLKMAHKRAYVHGVIMATAAGSIFTQDVEDLPEGMQEPERELRPVSQPPQRQSATTPSQAAAHAPETPGNPGAVISEAQAKRLYAIAMQTGWTADELARFLKSEYGLNSDRDVPRRQYDEIIRKIQDGASH